MLTERITHTYFPYGTKDPQSCVGGILQGYEILRKGDELLLRISFVTQEMIEVLQFDLIYSLDASLSVHNAAANITPFLGKTLSKYTIQGDVYTWDFNGEGFTLVV